MAPPRRPPTVHSMFQTIAVGFDDSASAHDALALAGALAGRSTRLLVVCSYPTGTLTARVMPPEHGALGRDDAVARLEAARSLLRDRPAVDLVAREASSAAAGLEAAAREAEADLIVVGSSHRGAIGRVLPGSTAAQMLHAAPCAVAVAPAGLRDAGPIRLHDIGVGFDGGAEARAALELAGRLASERGGRLHAIAVVEPVTQTFGWAGAWMYPEFREDALADAHSRLDEALSATEHADDAVVEVLDGMPAAELLRASEGLDLLALGSRGYGPLGRLLLGSVATRVADSCACPLLVTPRAAAPSS